MGVIHKKPYELFIFYGRTMSTKWNQDKFEVWMDI